jgi:soluble lytic murein transglycosylase-like protein
VLSIAAYNCGPTKIKKTVMKGRDLDRMTPEQVVALVRQLAPEETRNYVVRVRERMELYRGM